MSTQTTTNFTIRLDTKLKSDAETLFNDLGLTLSSAVNVFLRQSLIANGIPFEIKRKEPNKATLAAMEESKSIAKNPRAKGYSDVEEALRELKK